MAKRRRRKRIYRARVSGDGRAVTAPDGTVSLVGPAKDGFRITGVLNEPFASLFAEPFDPERFVRTVANLDHAQKKRMEKLHKTLEKNPAGQSQSRNGNVTN